MAWMAIFQGPLQATLNQSGPGNPPMGQPPGDTWE